MSQLGQVSNDARITEQIDEEWEEFVQENAFRDESGMLIWGESLIRSMGETGLKTLRYLARRGHFESARALKETFLGMPSQPLSVRVQPMSSEETRILIIEHLKEHGKLTEASADALTERFKQAALEDAALNALPEPK